MTARMTLPVPEPRRWFTAPATPAVFLRPWPVVIRHSDVWKRTELPSGSINEVPYEYGYVLHRGGDACPVSMTFRDERVEWGWDEFAVEVGPLVHQALDTRLLLTEGQWRALWSLIEVPASEAAVPPSQRDCDVWADIVADPGENLARRVASS